MPTHLHGHVMETVTSPSKLELLKAVCLRVKVRSLSLTMFKSINQLRNQLLIAY